MSSSSDLQALFANIKPRPGSTAPINPTNPPPTQPPNGNASPFNAATLFNRQGQTLGTPPAHSQSRMNSPLSGAGPDGDRAQSLLNLLKSGQSVKDGSQDRMASETLGGSTGASAHGRGISASDLVAGFMNSPAVVGAAGRQSVPPHSSATTSSAQLPGENPQAALLKLLNRTQSSQAPQLAQPDFVPHENVVPSIERDLQDDVQMDDRTASPIRVFGSTESKETTPFAVPQVASPSTQKENQPLFTYTNPFEALTAMSRNQTPQPHRQGPTATNIGGGSAGDKRPSKEASPEPSAFAEHASQRRKLTPRLRKTSSTPESGKKETVAETLGYLAGQASKAADEALAEVLEGPVIKQEPVDDEKVDLDALADQLQETAIEAAVEMKKELDKPENKGILEQELPTSLARDVRSIIDSAAENATDQFKSSTSAGDLAASREVPVYNFPIKPFVSITLHLPQQAKATLRDDGVMEISRFKKEFDQLDRTLAAATSKYIAYALVKTGGMRVIRQDDGSDRQAFKHTHDRIFNIAMCATATNSTPTEEQAILGTGLSGAVYYATIFRDGNDLFEQDALESESLIFPPYPLGDENTSGGQLKTRAKKSSRHPEFFAIGRGKHIHLIWPTLAMSPKYGVQGDNRRVDIEKFYKERTLKITTGKAGKDFSFSEDDTTIVSLDKTGRMRFWDIRQLIDESNATAPKIQPVDIRIPLLTLSTTLANEKVWPTSALFIDKLRPYSKATALRYVLVGLRQNHTLQLWDIGLGKAVQEINFPHSSENDGICSINYHPGSGIIVVGHPTRNSIYFIHLSAPRYGLPPMSQATYLERLVVKDTELPKPESTACMSGIREISFAAKGQLRSIELLPVHKSSAQSAEEPLPLFELYVVHSRGVTCLSIRKQDLGWGEESKTLHPVNALDAGLITIRSLESSDAVEDDGEVNGEAELETLAKPSKKKSEKVQEPEEPIIRQPAAAPREASPAKVDSQDTGNETQTKKKKKKSQQPKTLSVPEPDSDRQRSSRSVSPNKPTVSLQDQTMSATLDGPLTFQPLPSSQPADESSIKATAGAENGINVGISGDWLNREMKKLESGVTIALRKDFDHLHRKIDMERKVQDAAAGSRQEAMLRLISETLSDNVEKSLARIVISNFQQSVIPSMTSVTVQTVENVLVRHLHGIVPNEVGKHLPAAISAAMASPQTLRVLTDSVSQKIAHSVENAFTELLHTTVTPSFKNLAINTAETMSMEVERRVMQQLQTYEAERQVDRRKIDDVMDTVNGMAKTLADMAHSQIGFQQQILQDRRSSQSRAPNGEATIAEKSPVDAELDGIKALITSGDYHNATLQVRHPFSNPILPRKVFLQTYLRANLLSRSGSNRTNNRESLMRCLLKLVQVTLPQKLHLS